jgi:tRNA(Glu) U13 pseudouridine synthase TruD
MQKIQAKLKTTPEDFIVEEIHETWHCKISKDFIQPEIKITPSEKNFLCCELEKKGIDHFSAIKEIATQLEIPNRQISYAGSKDKIAHTCQRISIESPDLRKVKNFSHPNIILKNFKWNKRKIKLGYLDANHFKITLRDLDKKDAIKISSQIRKTKFFPNYFGPQRFGINNSNIPIGKALIKRNFDKALKLIEQDSKRKIPSLKIIPRKNMLMYVNAVQSLIFNEIVSQALEEKINLEQKGQQNGMLAGYKMKFSQGRLGEIEQEILEKHNLTLEDFNITEIPFLRIKGSYRKAIIPIQDLEVETSDDEEFSGSKKINLEFTLPSGAYATTFLENFFIL